MISKSDRECFEKVLCCCKIENDGREMYDDDDVFSCKPLRVKESILIYGRKRSYFPLHCMVGPDWPINILVFALIIGIDVPVLYAISMMGWPPLLIGLFGLTGLLCAYAHVAFSDPGIIYKSAEEERKSSERIKSTEMEGNIGCGDENSFLENNTSQSIGGLNLKDLNSGAGADIEATAELPSYTSVSSTSMAVNLSTVRAPIDGFMPKVPQTMECGMCQISRPISSSHCAYCGTCVDYLDHHCPWSGKCIAAKNMIYFNLFLGFLSFQCYFLLGASIYWIIWIVTKAIPPYNNAL